MINKNKSMLAALFMIIMYVVCSYNATQYYFAVEKLTASQFNLSKETEKSVELCNKLNEANSIIADLKNEEYELVYIGEYKISHYCAEKYEHICGTGSGKTATGTKVTPGRTIAVDPTVIPYGSQVYIEGYGFRTAEDCGGWVKGKHIDMAVNTHDDAMSSGLKNAGVWMIVKKR